MYIDFPKKFFIKIFTEADLLDGTAYNAFPRSFREELLIMHPTEKFIIICDLHSNIHVLIDYIILFHGLNFMLLGMMKSSNH